MDERILKTLTYLKDCGVAEPINISNLLNELFPLPEKLEQFDMQKSRLISFLQTLRSNEYISYNAFQFDYIRTTSDVSNGLNSWFGEIAFIASLTTKGDEYIIHAQNVKREQRIGDSVVATNKAIITTNEALVINATNQSNLYRATLYLTALNLLVGGGILYATLTSNSDKQEIETLHTQVTSQSKELKRLQLLKSDTLRYVLHYPLLKNKGGKKP